MERLDKNILDSIIFGFVKNVIESKSIDIDCGKNNIYIQYNISILYIQYDYLVNTDANKMTIFKKIDDIICNEVFLEKLRLFIESKYNCCVPEVLFQEVIQEVISTIKSEIQSVKTN